MKMIYFRLNELLDELGCSQTRFSRLSGVRPNTINDMCNGRTKRLEVETLNLIMDTLNEEYEREIRLEDLVQYRKENENSGFN